MALYKIFSNNRGKICALDQREFAQSAPIGVAAAKQLAGAAQSQLFTTLDT